MASLIAAGAASSCAGYLIGSLAMKQQQQQQQRVASKEGGMAGGGGGGSVNKQQQQQQQRHLDGRSRQRRRPSSHAYAHAPRQLNTTMTNCSAKTKSTSPPSFLPPPRPPLPGQCPLCHSWFQHGEVVARLECGHVNHKECTETVSRQPVFVGFRCTCAVCNGPSVILKLAVTEVVRPLAVTAPAPAPAPASVTHLPPHPAPVPLPLPLPLAAAQPSTQPSPVYEAAPSLPRLDHAYVQSPPEHHPRSSDGRTLFRLQGGAKTGMDDNMYPSCTLCGCRACCGGINTLCDRCGQCICTTCANECACACACVCDTARSTFAPLY